MADANSSAAALAATQPMKIENISLPGFGGGASSTEFKPEDYSVKYGKFDMDDLGAVAELELIETKGLVGIDIVVLNKVSYTFMTSFFLIVTYLEKNGPTS